MISNILMMFIENLCAYILLVGNCIRMIFMSLAWICSIFYISLVLWCGWIKWWDIQETDKCIKCVTILGVV